MPRRVKYVPATLHAQAITAWGLAVRLPPCSRKGTSCFPVRGGSTSWHLHLFCCEQPLDLRDRFQVGATITPRGASSILQPVPTWAQTCSTPVLAALPATPAASTPAAKLPGPSICCTAQTEPGAAENLPWGVSSLQPRRARQ